MGEYDYSLPGLYFITICTYNKKAILSKIVGAHHDAPAKIILTPYGIIVEKSIEELSKRFKLNIEKYVIMPDHIHILIELADYERYERAIRESPLQTPQKDSAKNRSIMAQCIGYLKTTVTKEIHKIEPTLKVWQRGYYDHVIRSEADYFKHYDYIENNPVDWIMGKHTDTFPERSALYV